MELLKIFTQHICLPVVGVVVVGAGVVVVVGTGVVVVKSPVVGIWVVATPVVR